MKFERTCIMAAVLACIHGVALAQNEASAPAVAKADQVAQATESEVLAETVITATRTATTADQAPGAVHVVNKERMEARNIKSLDQVVNTVPGVYNKRAKGLMDTTTGIVMRGMVGEARNLIMQDGLPMNNGYTGAVSWGGNAAENFNAAEIALGGASSLYGNHAMGGVINYVSQMPKKREFRFKLGYGDGSELAMQNLRRGFVSFGDRFDNGFSIYASYATASTDGYRADLVTSSAKNPPAGTTGAVRTGTATGGNAWILGEKGRSGWDDSGITLRAAYALPDNGEVRLSYMRNRYHYRYGDDPITYLRDGLGVPVFRPSEQTFASGQGKRIEDVFQASLESALGPGRLRLNAGVRRGGTNWYTLVRSGGKLDGSGPGELNSTPMRMTYVDGQYTFSPASKHLVVVGGSLQINKANNTTSSLFHHSDIGSINQLVSAMGGKSRQIGIFAQDEISVTDKFTATVGLRWDHIKMSDGYQIDVANGLDAAYPSASHNALSPKLGLRYHINDNFSLRSSLGKSFRAPTVYDLYRVWYGSTGTEYGNNPFLKPETVVSFDIGADFKPWPGAEVKATYFHNRLKDMIFRRDISPTKKTWENAGKARSHGLELDLRQKMGQHFTLLANVTFNNTKMLDVPVKREVEGKKFQYIPDRMANLGLEWKRGPFDASAWLQYVSKRYTTDTNTDVVNGVYNSRDPHTLVHLKGGYQITKNLKASLSIDNLFNRKYFDSTYRAPGRSYYLELAGNF